MIQVILIFGFGLALSAFFSGSETGFYRVTRMRLLIDALTGDWIARAFLWTTNHPSVFVAVALVGNNLANYFSSLSVVMGAQLLFPQGNETAELVAPLLLAPVLFIYGELLPKHVFYEAPYRLLRRCGPGLLIAAVLFAPITLILWAFNKFLQFVVRQSPQVIEMVLARRELTNLLAEGHEAGILMPTQQILTQTTFALGGKPLSEFMTPSARYPIATSKMTAGEVLLLARTAQQALIPVEDSTGKGKMLGYLRAADLAVTGAKDLPPCKPLMEFKGSDTYLSALLKMIESDHQLAHVVGKTGQTVGFVRTKDLTEALLTADS